MVYSQEGIEVTRLKTVNLAYFNFHGNFSRIFPIALSLSLWSIWGGDFTASLDTLNRQNVSRYIEPESFVM